MRLSFEFSNILGAVYHRGSIKFGPDGTSIFSPVGNKIIMYDIKANKHDAMPIQVNYNISQLAIHPHGTLMLASSEKSHLYLISLINGKQLHFKEYKSFSKISHISFSPDGCYYCVCGGNLALVYITPGSLIAGKGREILPFKILTKIRVGHDTITDLTWSADSSQICIASQDTSLNVYDIHGGKSVIHLRGHTDIIQNCYFDLDLQIYSLTKNCVLSVWEVQKDDDDEQSDDEGEGRKKNKKKKLKKILKYHRASKHYLRLNSEAEEAKEEKHRKANAFITASSYNQNAKLLVVGYNTGHYSLYEMPSANLIYVFDSSCGSISSISVNPTGDWIAFGSSVDAEADRNAASNKTQSRLFVWEWQSKSHVLDQIGSGATMSNMHECVSYSLDGTHIVSGNLAGRIKVWSAITGETVATFGEEHKGPIKAIKFVPNKSGKVIVSASLDGTLRAYDLNKFKNFRTFQSSIDERRPEFICLDIDSTGEFIAAGTYNYFEIYLYSLQTGKFLEYLTGHEGPVSGVAFSPVSNLLVSSSWDSTVRIWNLFDGSKCVRDIVTFNHEVITVAFRPDGNQIAASLGNGQIVLINPHTSDQLGGPIEGMNDLGTTQLISDSARDSKKYFMTLNYSADGTFLIAAGKSNYICIYHAEQKLLMKRIALTFNMSMDGVFDYISNRRRNEFGFTMELLESRGEERSAKPIQLPGVKTGDLGERKVVPVIAAYQIVFSPTMRSFVAATTEGVLVFSLDVSKNFNPYKLSVGVDPQSIRAALKSKTYGQAFVESLQLNDKELLQEVIETIPISEMETIIPGLELDFVKRGLAFIGQTISKTRHLEHYLELIKAMLYKHGVGLKSLSPNETASIVRALYQNCHRYYMDLQQNCDFARYSLEYLTKSLGDETSGEVDGDIAENEMN